MNYFEFEVEDFASDDLFIKWVLRGDAEATRFWVTYLSAHPELEPKIQKARALLLNLHKAEQTSPAPAQVNKIWNNIQTELGRDDERGRSFISYRIAATISILALATAGIWYGVTQKSEGLQESSTASKQASDPFIEELNNTGSTIRVHLSDGSIVTLENESRLKYQADYTGDSVRQVYLEGEAFFDIAKNQQQPFLVYANEVVTKVLGTSFRIKAFENEKNVIVSVKEGKVSVYSSLNKKEKSKAAIESKVNGVVLTSNQQVLYNRSDDAFNKSLIQMPEIIKEYKAETNFQFDNAPINQVFTTLEEAYGVEIIFQEDVMANCFLTAPLGDEPLFEKLKIICRTIGANYELIDAKIVINSKGC